MNRRVGNLDFLPTRYAILQNSLSRTPHPDSRVSHLSADVVKTRMQLDTGKSQGVTRLIPTPHFERRDKLTLSCAACRKFQDNRRSGRVRPDLHTHVASRASCWFLGLEGCTEVRLCALTPRARIHPTHVLDDTQALFLLCCLKLPNAPPNCMRQYFFVVLFWG